MTSYSEIRRLLQHSEPKDMSIQELQQRANYALFCSRIFRSVPAWYDKRRSLVLLARALRSIIRQRNAQ